MSATDIKKMEELLTQEEFALKIQEAGSYENAYKLFAENGVEASREEFMDYIAQCRKAMEEKGLISADGELSIEMLELVSGGKWYHAVPFIVGGVALVLTGHVYTGGVLLVVGGAVWNM